MPTRELDAIRPTRILLAIPLLFLLVACGNASNTIPSATPTQQNTNSSMPSSPALKTIDLNTTNIHIHSGFGITCLNYPTLNVRNPNGLTANLVLATNRLTYDSSELQQMRTYAAAIYNGHLATIPSTLKLVQGTMASNSPFPSNLVGAGCFGEIELTNLGKDAIQIRSINMQLSAVPKKTSGYQYRMIDICSLIGNVGCPPGAGGAGPTIYLFRLKAASVGTIFTPDTQDQFFTNNDISNVVLDPNDVGALPIIFYFISLDKLSYYLTPELVLRSPYDASQIVPLPQLATTLYFADPNQFSCYTLQGDTFVRYKEDNNDQYCL